MTILFSLLVTLVILADVILIESNINAAIAAATPQEDGPPRGRGRGVVPESVGRRAADSARGAFVVNSGRRGSGSVSTSTTSSSPVSAPSVSHVVAHPVADQSSIVPPSVSHVAAHPVADQSSIVPPSPVVVAPAHQESSAAASSHSSTSAESNNKKRLAKDIPNPMQLQIEIEKMVSAGLLKNNPSSIEAYVSTRVGAPVKIKKGVVGEVANTLLSAIM